MLLTGPLLERLRDEVRRQPLAPGEVRRIPGMGLHALCLGDGQSAEGLSVLCSLRIDGVLHTLCHAG